MRPHREQQRVLVGNAGESEQADAAEGDGADALGAKLLSLWY
jgi:hypothetical protein